MGPRHGSRERRGSRARRGAVRDALLVVLAERPMYGYEVITELESRSSGRWRPSPGSIYPALRRLAEQGLVTAEDRGDKKVFSLTDIGLEARERVDLGDDPTPDRWRDAGDAHGALRALPAEIAGQARQLRRFGSPDQIDRAVALLEDVKRELYGVLASGPAADEQAEPDDEERI